MPEAALSEGKEGWEMGGQNWEHERMTSHRRSVLVPRTNLVHTLLAGSKLGSSDCD